MCVSRRDGAWVKRERIGRLSRMLRGLKNVDLKLFVAQAEYELGLNPDTIERYLEILVKQGEVFILDGVINPEEASPDV